MIICNWSSKRVSNRVPVFILEEGSKVDYASLIDSLIYVVPLLALMVSIRTFTNASRERHSKTAADAAELKSDIKHLSSEVMQMRERYEKAADGYHKVDGRLIKLESKAESLEKRMRELEETMRYAD